MNGPRSLRSLREGWGSRRRRRTLAEVAAAAGISTGHLSRIERGIRGTHAQTLGRIARALRVEAKRVLLAYNEDRKGGGPRWAG